MKLHLITGELDPFGMFNKRGSSRRKWQQVWIWYNSFYYLVFIKDKGYRSLCHSFSQFVVRYSLMIMMESYKGLNSHLMLKNLI